VISRNEARLVKKLKVGPEAGNKGLHIAGASEAAVGL